MSLGIWAPSPPETLKKATLTQTRLRKDGFNNQSSKAFFAGCPWKFGQPGPTEKLKEGALKHTRLSKDGFNNPSSKDFLQDVLGNFDNQAKERSSRKEPSNREV